MECALQALEAAFAGETQVGSFFGDLVDRAETCAGGFPVLAGLRAAAVLAGQQAVRDARQVVAAVAESVGRIRPTELVAGTGWEGYSYPSRPVAGLALVTAGAVYTLAPRGPVRVRLRWVAAVLVLSLAAASTFAIGKAHSRRTASRRMLSAPPRQRQAPPCAVRPPLPW